MSKTRELLDEWNPLDSPIYDPMDEYYGLEIDDCWDCGSKIHKCICDGEYYNVSFWVVQ